MITCGHHERGHGQGLQVLSSVDTRVFVELRPRQRSVSFWGTVSGKVGAHFLDLAANGSNC